MLNIESVKIVSFSPRGPISKFLFIMMQIFDMLIGIFFIFIQTLALFLLKYFPESSVF